MTATRGSDTAADDFMTPDTQDERVICRQTTITLQYFSGAAANAAANAAAGAPADSGADAAERPLLLFLHGALRNKGSLLPIAPAYAEFDRAFCDLPGHGGSERPLDYSLADYAGEIASLLRRRFSGRDIVLVGESMGGLIALRAALDPRLNILGLVLADPPLTCSKQWALRATMRQMAQQGRSHKVMAELSEPFFGMSEAGEVIGERHYYRLLDELQLPCLVLTGTEPLFPARQAEYRVPCCLDEFDLYLLRRLYPDRVSIRRIEDCGHTLLVEQPQASAEAIRGFIAGLL